MHRRAHSLASLWVQPAPCERPKSGAAVRGAAFGVGVAGGVALVVMLVRIAKIAATFSGERTRYPFVETAVGSAALFAALEAVEWERRCG